MEKKLLAKINASIKKDFIVDEIVGISGFSPNVENQTNEDGISTTEIYPLTIAEAETILEWCAYHNHRVTFEETR